VCLVAAELTPISGVPSSDRNRGTESAPFRVSSTERSCFNASCLLLAGRYLVSSGNAYFDDSAARAVMRHRALPELPLWLARALEI